MADPRPPLPRLSVLDLVPIVGGRDPAGTPCTAAATWRGTPSGWGYRRYWLAEHHNMTGIASAATAVVIGHVAGGTSTIRVGAGGIMLPNHAPLVIAEQFGTLESLYPGRIDLGLGPRARAPTSCTMRALRRDPARADDFPQDVLELQALLRRRCSRARPCGRCPARASRCRSGSWARASSARSSPRMLGPALRLRLALRARPPARRAPDLPRALPAVGAASRRPTRWRASTSFAADTDDEARRLFTSLQQRVHRPAARQPPGPFRPPLDDIDAYWSPPERDHVSRMLRHSVVGSPETVRARARGVRRATGADELMVVSAIHDHAARLRSFEIVAEVAGQVGVGEPVGMDP